MRVGVAGARGAPAHRPAVVASEPLGQGGVTREDEQVEVLVEALAGVVVGGEGQCEALEGQRLDAGVAPGAQQRSDRRLGALVCSGGRQEGWEEGLTGGVRRIEPPVGVGTQARPVEQLPWRQLAGTDQERLETAPPTRLGGPTTGASRDCAEGVSLRYWQGPEPSLTEVTAVLAVLPPIQ